jgi:hypothetical protein
MSSVLDGVRVIDFGQMSGAACYTSEKSLTLTFSQGEGIGILFTHIHGDPQCRTR